MKKLSLHRKAGQVLNMVLYILLILQGFVSIVYSEACADFYFGSSHYQATFVEADYYSDFKRWNEVNVLCQQSGYQLVSITTSDENDAIFNSLENCPRGDYAIGLSRQSGMPRSSASSWNWESGESAVNLLNWASNEPNTPDSTSAAVHTTTLATYEPGKWYDIGSTERIGLSSGSPGYGYICEKSMITTPQISTVAGTSMQPLTSALQLSTTYRRPTSISPTVIGETKERTDISDETTTKANTEATLSVTAGGTTTQLSTNDEPITKAITDDENNGEQSASQLSTTAAIHSFTSGVQSTFTYRRPILISTTVTGETNERTGISDEPLTKANTDKDTTAGGTTIQSSTTFTLPRTYNSGERITKTGSDGINNDEKDLIIIVLASLSAIAIAVVALLLLYMYRDQLFCKSKNETDQELTNRVVEVMPCDIYSINLDTENTPEQGTHPGTIEVQVNNTQLYVNHTPSGHDKERPNVYECRKYPHYEQYQEEEMVHVYAEITDDSERKVDEALTIDPERLYDSPE